MKAIGKLREEGHTRYFFLISLSSSPILSRQPLPWNHFVDSPQLFISFNVQVVRTAKYAYFASYLDYKRVRSLSYFSWNIHSIHLTPVNENLFRHWFSVAIIRGRSRTVYQSGREKRRTKVFKYGRGLKIGMYFRDLAPIVQKLDVQRRNGQFWDLVLEKIM